MAVEHDHESGIDYSALFKIVTDLAACGMTIAFIAMRIPTKLNSVASTSTLVGELGQLPWESTDLTLVEVSFRAHAHPGLSAKLLTLIFQTRKQNSSSTDPRTQTGYGRRA
jgi:hypothetical protein